jgi:hypothetical protein
VQGVWKKEGDQKVRFDNLYIRLHDGPPGAPAESWALVPYVYGLEVFRLRKISGA